MERNLTARWILIAVVLVLGVFSLFDMWNRRLDLQPGLDIAGGVSLVYEINTDDLAPGEEGDLAENMKALLQKRVDPSGVYNLVWRVHGANRIEVQMPLPPKGAKELRDAYVEAEDALFRPVDADEAGQARGWNLRRGEIERVLQSPAEQRTAALQALARGSEERARLLAEVATAYDAYSAARAAHSAYAATQPATDTSTAPAGTTADEELQIGVRDAAEDYEDAMEKLMATNLNPSAFRAVLEAEKQNKARGENLAEYKKRFPALAAAIDEVVEKYDAWRGQKRALEGPQDLQRLLRGAGVLEFRILSEPSPQNVTKYAALRKRLQEVGPRRQPGDAHGWFKVENPVAFFNLTTAADLKTFDPSAYALAVAEKRGDEYYVLAELAPEQGLLRDSAKKWQLKRAFIDRDENGRLCVDFQLDPVGGDLFGDLTSRNINRPLCILLDDVAYSAPNINNRINTMGTITGDFTFEKVSYLKQCMEAGSLPARLKETPVSERVIGSSLGETNLRKAVMSGLIGAILVLLIMAIYYRWLGLIAYIAMLTNVFLTLAMLAFLNARLTLDGIAGIILSIGMSVDANVLIYERMREEKLRGASLRMIFKNGYDKAVVTIIDSNLTTLLTCIILYYVGNEEVRGFGLTLGWGIALNLFTSVFLTRAIFGFLLKKNLIKDISMMRVIGIPNINWAGKARFFLPTSAIVILLGMVLLFARGARALDVEFLGGINAEIELKTAGLDDVQIAEKLRAVGGEIRDQADLLSQATVTAATGDARLMRVSVPELDSARLLAFIAEPLEDQGVPVRGGVQLNPETGEVTVRADEDITPAQLQEKIRALAGTVRISGEDIRDAGVSSVIDTAAADKKGLLWNVTTTATNKLLVQHALATALGDTLRIQQRVNYVVREQNGLAWPITERRLEQVLPLPAGVTTDVNDFLGGAAMYFDQVQPPQTVQEVRLRLRNMRLQPGYEDYPWREVEVVGIQPAGKDAEGKQTYSSLAVLVSDPTFTYMDAPDRWRAELATREAALSRAALDTEQALRRVSQFKPQIAAQSKTRASMALILSWAMIIAYVWIRFGKPIYGIAGVVALVHDVLVALAFIGLAQWLSGNPLSDLLLLDNFKINMPVIAALLTIIGFSINDTIVIFDRVREVRGRQGNVTPEIVNRAINECMSRTILTTFTVLMVLLAMYIWGGSSIRGFNFTMLAGCLSGVYSTVAIAGPLLLLGQARKAARTAAPAGSAARA